MWWPLLALGAARFARPPAGWNAWLAFDRGVTEAEACARMADGPRPAREWLQARLDEEIEVEVGVEVELEIEAQPPVSPRG